VSRSVNDRLDREGPHRLDDVLESQRAAIRARDDDERALRGGYGGIGEHLEPG
jgi:hypothetical protein